MSCQHASWVVPEGMDLFAGILSKRSPRSAGAFCRDFTEKKSPQCRAYTWALQMEKSISLFPGPEGAVVANDWCITGKPLWFEPAQEKWFKSNNVHISICGLLRWIYFEHLLYVMTYSCWVKVP